MAYDVGGNQSFAATVTYSPTPTGGFDRGEGRYLDGALSDWANVSTDTAIIRNHHAQEPGQTGWSQSTGATVAITLDEGTAREAEYLYVHGISGTAGVVWRPTAAKLEWSDDGSSWTVAHNLTGLTGSNSPLRTWTIRFATTGLSHRYWRVTLTHGGQWIMFSSISHGSPIVSLAGILTTSPAPNGSFPLIGTDRLLSTASNWESTPGGHILGGARYEVADPWNGGIGFSQSAGAVSTITLDNLAAVPADYLAIRGHGGEASIEEPTAFVVQYSDDNSTWTTHETRTLTDQGQPGGRHWWALFNITGAVHRYWRAQMTHGNQWIFIIAFELWAGHIDLAIGRPYTFTPAADGAFPNTTTPYVRTFPGDGAWVTGGGKLTDGDPAYWGTFSTAVGWNNPTPGIARLDLGSAQAGERFVVHGIQGSGTAMRTPASVVLAYSDDDSAWTTIWTKSSLTTSQAGKGRWVAVADITGVGAHRYWRVSVTTGSGLFPALTMLEFWQATVAPPAPPDPPADPTATTQSSSEILVEWTDTADETGYRVERSDDGTTGWTDVSGDLAADTISYLDSGLDPSTQYFYRIIAFNDEGDSDPSDVVDDTTDSPTPPVAPPNPSATAQSATEILVEWDDVTGETGYRVERSPNGTTGWTDVSGPLPTNTTSYLDTGLTPETTYFYRIIATNLGVDGPPSDVVSATTPIVIPAIPVGITKPWLEVWTRPGAADYGKKIADLPILEASVQVPYSGVGKGSMSLAANYARVDEIIMIDPVDSSNSVWSTIKVVDDTGWLYEWLPGPRIPQGGKNATSIEFAGDGLEAIWSFARVEPWDWDGSANFASTFPDWIWGGRNLLSNPGFEGSTPSPIIDEVWITEDSPPTDPTGTFTLSDGTNTTDALAWNAGAAVVEAELEEAGIYDDCLVAGSGTTDDPWVIEAVAPFEGVTLSVDDTSVTGGTGHVRRVQFGSLQPNGWTRSATVSAGVPRTFGAYDSFRVTDEQAHSGDFSLRIDPALVESNSVRYAGAQQVVTVKPGGVYQAKVWVYPTSATDTYRFIIRGIDGDFIKAFPGGLTSTTLTPDTWNELIIEDVPVGTNTAVIFRIAVTVPVGVDPEVFYVDDAEFNEGMAPTTVGDMLTQLYDDATTDHSLAGRMVWENESTLLPGGPNFYLTLDFDVGVDSNGIAWDRDDVNQTFRPRMTYGQVIDQITEEGAYDWRVVPDDVAAGTYLLQVYNPGDLGSVKAAGIIGGSVDTARSARYFAPSSTAQLAEGDADMSARVENSGLVATFGRIEGAILDQNWTTFSSLSSAAIMMNTEQLRGAEGVVYTLASPAQRPLHAYRPGDRISINDPPILDEYRRVSQIQLSISKGQPDEFVVHISDAIPFRFLGGAGVKLSRGLIGQAATDNAVAALLSAYKRTERVALPSTRIFGGGGQPTVTVAAANATDTSKGKADLVCDGANDDQLIQQGFEMLGSRGGKIVLTEGVFHFGLAGVILPPVDFHLHGMGRDATEIVGDVTANYLFLDGLNTGENEQQQISDLTLNGDDNTAVGIRTPSTVGGQNLVLVDNVDIHDFTSHGIFLERPAGEWRLRRSRFFNNGGAGALCAEAGATAEDCQFFSNTGIGLFITLDGNGKVADCLFRQNGGAGFGAGNAISGGIGGFVITGNRFLDNTGYGIELQHGDSNLVEANIFDGNTTGSMTFGAGGFGVSALNFVTGNIQIGTGTFVNLAAGSGAFQSNNVVNGTLVP